MQIIIIPYKGTQRPGSDTITVVAPDGQRMTLTRVGWSRLFYHLGRELDTAANTQINNLIDNVYALRRGGQGECLKNVGKPKKEE